MKRSVASDRGSASKRFKLDRAESAFGTSLLGKNAKTVLTRTSTPDDLATAFKVYSDRDLTQYTEVEADWTVQKGAYRAFDSFDEGARELKVGQKLASKARMPTFYSERFLSVDTPGAKNLGTDQGPHTVAHALNELVLEAYSQQGKVRGIEARDALRKAFDDLIRPPDEVETLVAHLVPDYAHGTGDIARGARAGLDGYRQEHGLLMKYLGDADADALSSNLQVTQAFQRMSALMNLDPASTYGWHRPDRASDAELAGKGEGYALERLKTEIAQGKSDNAERRRVATLRVAKELRGWLLDLPDGIDDTHREAIEAIQQPRIRALLEGTGLHADAVIGHFGDGRFLAWVSAEKLMRDAQGKAQCLAAIKAQVAFNQVLGKDSVKIQLPTAFKPSKALQEEVTKDLEDNADAWAQILAS